MFGFVNKTKMGVYYRVLNSDRSDVDVRDFVILLKKLLLEENILNKTIITLIGWYIFSCYLRQ